MSDASDRFEALLREAQEAPTSSPSGSTARAARVGRGRIPTTTAR
jgi:hypothetical protein